MDPISTIKNDRTEARKLDDANADTCFLALASPGGKASVRTLVMRDITSNHFRLFMNSSSPKWQLLQAGADYELLLWYPTRQRQYRVRGTARPLDPEVIGTNWPRRPLGSKLLDYFYQDFAPQSSQVESRQVLTNAISKIKQQYHMDEMPAPRGAAGYVLIANDIDMLDLNREDRIHDRHRFLLLDGEWQEHTLIP